MNLKHWLRSLSIKHKLMVIMMTTSGTAIILMALLVVFNQAINSQRTIHQQLITLSDVLGSRSTGALTFDDSATGVEILNALSLKSHIIYAVIERANGEAFASFGNISVSSMLYEYQSQQITDPLTPIWRDLFSNEIHVMRDIFLEGEKIGRIRIVSTLDSLHNDVLNYMLLVSIISVICFIITFLICTRLQKLVSTPILDLQQTMDLVSNNEDYSLRVNHNEENELGVLIDGFNHMLEQIQNRDNKLAANSNHLKRTVATRTIQLSDVKEKRILWLESMARFLKHELKNSSVGIKTSLDLIERRSSENKQIDIYLSRARKSMNNMNSLLQSAGNASNLEASLYKEQQKTLDLGLTVINHMDIYSSIYPDTLIKIDCEPQVFIQGNDIRLMQLLDKLISNAVDHSDDSTPIQVSVSQCKGKAILSVSNNGDKLPQDKQAIFELFVSFRSLEQKSDDNCGLGLYIVKLIAESHAGKVTANNLDQDAGAIFEVSIPLLAQN